MEKGKVLLTGASGGLGIPVVSEILKESWQVFALVHSEESRERLQKWFPGEYDRQLQVLEGDVTLESDVMNALEKAGNITALVHLAGGFKGAQNMEDQTGADYERLFSLNVWAAFLLLKNVLPGMKRQKKGRIVTIGAKPALYPTGENAVYAASKAALTNLTLSAAEEGRACNVQANMIVPAVINTEENKKWAGKHTEIENWTPPEDIARTIAWLISENGTGVTGSIIPMFHKMPSF